MTQRGGGWRAEGGREHGAGAAAGTRRVTGAQQYSLAVLSICNNEPDPGTCELGLIFSWSLGLHAQVSSPSASALLTPNWCNSHLNKPTCRHLGKANATEAALTPSSLQCKERAVLSPPVIFTCPPRCSACNPFLTGKRKKGFLIYFYEV